MRKSAYWLAGLLVGIAACGGDEKPPVDSGSSGPYSDPYAGSAPATNTATPAGMVSNKVEFVVKKDDGIFYGVEQLSEIPFTGEIEEDYAGGGVQFIKTYSNGVLTVVEEFYPVGQRKKSKTVYNDSGQVVSKEEWQEDGTQVVAGGGGPNTPKSDKVGRNVKWQEFNLNIYQGKPTSTVLAAFGLPDDRKIFQLATSYYEEWYYKNIKVIGFENKITLKTLKLRIEKKMVTQVQVY